MGKYTLEQRKERFYKKVNKTETCWIWLGTKGCTNDYGCVKLDGKELKAHRVSWEFSFGAIPKGMKVLHKCDNPICVNPDHLFLGTQEDNIADMVSKGRQRKHYGEFNSTAKLTKEQVLEIRRLYKGRGDGVKLAKMFGVTSANISYIIKNQTWNKGI